jgi:hypothetical protein
MFGRQASEILEHQVGWDMIEHPMDERRLRTAFGLSAFGRRRGQRRKGGRQDQKCHEVVEWNPAAK